jgi:hypothetical protein
MERKVSEPDVTTKHGQFKSKRKSKRDFSATVENLAMLEVLAEVSVFLVVFVMWILLHIPIHCEDIKFVIFIKLFHTQCFNKVLSYELKLSFSVLLLDLGACGLLGSLFVQYTP